MKLSNPKNKRTGKPMLSRRQLQVLEMKADGLTDRGVASRLRISRHTVDNHLRLARRKLGVGTTIAAVSRLQRHDDSSS